MREESKTHYDFLIVTPSQWAERQDVVVYACEVSIQRHEDSGEDEPHPQSEFQATWDHRTRFWLRKPKTNKIVLKKKKERERTQTEYKVQIYV